MRTKRSWPHAARRGRAASLMLTSLALAGCQTTGSLTPAPSPRLLPAAALIVPDPAERPIPKRGDDARLFARRALTYGDDNAIRLRDARAAYGALAERLAHPDEVP